MNSIKKLGLKKQTLVQCDRIVHVVHPQRRNDVQSSTKRFR